MKLVPVDPADVEKFSVGRRGGFCSSLLKEFLESNSPCSKLERGDTVRTLISMSASLSMYIRSRDLPVKVMQRQGEIYLVRMDLNADGTKNPDYRPKNAPADGKGGAPEIGAPEIEAPEINPAAVDQNYKEALSNVLE